MTECLTPNCRYPAAPALKRGLCMRCHTSAKKLVEEGGMTWDELVGLGLALATSDGDPFMDALNKKLEDSSANSK